MKQMEKRRESSGIVAADATDNCLGRISRMAADDGHRTNTALAHKKIHLNAATFTGVFFCQPLV